MTKKIKDGEFIRLEPGKNGSVKVCYKRIGIWANNAADRELFIDQLLAFKLHGIKTWRDGEGGWTVA